MVAVRRLFKHGKKLAGAFASTFIPKSGGFKAAGKLNPKNIGTFAVAAHLAGKRAMTAAKRGMSNPQSGLTTRVPYTKFKKGNANRVKGLKRVKVSPRLRKQILAVNEKSHIQGYMQESYKCTQYNVAPLTNTCAVIENVYLPNDSLGSVFSYNHILHCASRLWNGKGANSFPNVTDALNFDPLVQTIHVRKQWVTLRFKNNSQRTIRMRIVSATPHGTKTTVTPIAAWSSGITDMQAAKRLISNLTPTVGMMYTHPKIYDGFRNQYGTSEMDYTLEPGQAIEQNINGPGMIYDGGNFYQNGAVYNIFQKQDVFNFAVILPDLVLSSAGVPGHLSDSTALLATNFICFDATYHVQMSMPEPAGWQSGGVAPAAGAVPLVNRVKRFVLDDFNDFTPTLLSTEIRTDEEQPKT